MQRFFENSLFYFYFRFFFLLSGCLLQREERFTCTVQCNASWFRLDIFFMSSFIRPFMIFPFFRGFPRRTSLHLCYVADKTQSFRVIRDHRVSFTITSRNSFAREIPIVTQSLLSICRFLHDCSSIFFPIRFPWDSKFIDELHVTVNYTLLHAFYNFVRNTQPSTSSRYFCILYSQRNHNSKRSTLIFS